MGKDQKNMKYIITNDATFAPETPVAPAPSLNLLSFPSKLERANIQHWNKIQQWAQPLTVLNSPDHLFQYKQPLPLF